MKKLILLFVLFAAAGCAKEAVEDSSPEQTPQTKSSSYSVGEQMYNNHCWEKGHYYDCAQEGVYHHDGNGIVESSGKIWTSWYGDSGVDHLCGSWLSPSYVDFEAEHSGTIYVQVHTLVPASWTCEVSGSLPEYNRSVSVGSTGIYISYYAYSPYPIYKSIYLTIRLADGSDSTSFSVHIL